MTVSRLICELTKFLAEHGDDVYGRKEIQCAHCGYRVVVSPTHYADIQYYERFCSHCGNENIGVVNSDGDIE